MKKIILILSIFIIGLSIFAQEQSVKIYLNDGSEKIYNISDINNFRTIKAFQNLFMKIYFKDSTIEAFSASGVDSMLFNNNKIQVYTFGCMNEYEIVSIDSIIYSQNSETVRICDQVWMTRNLDVDHYRNGDSITQVTNPIEWHSLTTGAWCYYNHSDSLGRIYGKLYNLDAVNDTRGLAPQGWHIPSDVELTTLTNYLG